MALAGLATQHVMLIRQMKRKRHFCIFILLQKILLMASWEILLNVELFVCALLGVIHFCLLFHLMCRAIPLSLVLVSCKVKSRVKLRVEVNIWRLIFQLWVWKWIKRQWPLIIAHAVISVLVHGSRSHINTMLVEPGYMHLYEFTKKCRLSYSNRFQHLFDLLWK